MERKSTLRMKADIKLRIAVLVIGGGLLILLLFACGSVIAQQSWVAQAPGPNTRGQVENIEDGEVVGAIQAVAVHPTDPNIIYVGAVNGGIWKTTNGMAARPNWQPQTDGQMALSIGALEFDPTDATNQTLVAGRGCFSNFGRCSDAPSFLLRTTDGGANWTASDGGGILSGLNISGVAPRGATIVISVNAASNSAQVGVWRSTNTGNAWTQISGGSGTGLPRGASADLVSDPSNRDRLFTNAGGNGLFRSTNAGATWAKVSNAALDTLIASAGNVKISVGTSNNVYVAIVKVGELAGIFRSGDGGTSWTAMGLPTTVEGGIHPGRQGGTNLSIAADRSNAQLVYVGGDRQPSPIIGGVEVGFSPDSPPNSIGAKDYSGRLFRGDASKPVGSQWVHLTHSNSQGAVGGGTANNSAPHADSRNMVVAANGMLIEVDDGGIYRRTSPQTNTGDWFSMNGNIQTTEFHAIAWDANSHLVIGGAQDTGTPAQQLRSNVRWQSVTTGDGGVVAVDDTSSPGLSTRYSSFQFLDSFRREVYNAANVLQRQDFPRLIVLGGGNPLSPQFYTPIKLNTVTATRLIIGAGNSVYESLDQGDTITEIGRNIVVNDTGPNIIAYGGAGNANMLYVGSGAQVFVRTVASPAALTPATAYPGGSVVGIAINPNDPRTAYVIDLNRVFRTTDSGSTWTNITGNLPTLAPGSLHTVAYSTSTPVGAVVVGSDTGVFEAPGAAFSTWSRLGTGLPRVPVYHLEYDSTDSILLAGTLGRGAWTLPFPSLSPPLANGGSAAEPRTLPVVAVSNQRAPQRAPSGGTPSRQPQDMSVFQLRPGMIVNAAERRAYIMSPAGGIEAVDLTNGEPVWNTKTAARPLGLAGQRLIAQTELPDAANNMQVVVLDAVTGTPRLTRAMGLPDGIKATVVGTLRGEFEATAQPSGGDAVIAWEFKERPLKGMRPGTQDRLSPPRGAAPPPGAATPTVNTRSGAYRLNLSTGRVSTIINAPGVTFLRSNRAALLSDTERIPALPETQFLSADGRHVLISELTGDDRVWEKYKLTIYDRNSGERVGEFKSHISLVPFFVLDSTVIYETGPYVRRTETSVVEEPLKIRAVDLRTGKELWSRQIRDTTYRGPSPP